ncbi:MAG: PEP-CTERM system histidine kinase PrsK [Rhodoferax sp.]|nr:PEP-CTERM system histidine kinase PrsK [Rhodoferax sp.]
MDSDNFLLTAWSYGLAGLVYSVFALSLVGRGYLRAPRELPRLALLSALVVSAVWAWMLVALILLGHRIVPHIVFAFEVLRYGAWFWFLLILLKVRQHHNAGNGMPLLVPTAVLVLLVAGTLSGMSMLDLGPVEHIRKLSLFSALALPVMAMVLLEQLFRNVSEDSRWNIKPLSVGLAGAFLFDIYLYAQGVLFNRLDGDAFSIRGAIHALVVPFLVLSTSRQSDWLDRIQISRKAAFHSATLMIAGLYLLFISGVGYYVRFFGGDWGRALQLGLVFLGLVVMMILALSATVRARLRVFLGKHFFRYRYDYREEWLRFTQTLAAKNSPQAMGEQVIRGLADMLESPGGGLWLKNRGETSYRQTARWNIAVSTVPENTDTGLSEFLKNSGWVVNLEEFRSFPRRYGQLVLPGWLQDIPQAWLIVPLNVSDDMIGFVVLARARARMDVNWEVNDLLKTAGRQAASFLAQMQATEALLEVRKFDAFNRMSAFVVHDLKNVVTQLSLMMKNAERLRNNPEFQQDMLLTVENSLDRMRQLMLQLREGATPPGTVVGVDLEDIARRMAMAASERGRRLEVDIAQPVVTRGHGERIERIVGHMVQNALDATSLDGRVWLKLDRVAGQAMIEVGDTGQGMTEEFVRERLFKPFQTTKKAGMGIGAYESFQYVQELGGKIEVISKVNQGTTITMLLPLFEIQRHSDLQPLGAS